MPAQFVHYYFADDILDKNIKHRKIALLGSQGPDIFFFYGFTYKIRFKKKKRAYFGSLLHKINMAPVYEYMIHYAYQKEGEEREILLSYVRGLMFHYSLDRNAHPYIFYRTGFDKDGNAKGIYSLSHSAFETRLDLMCKEAHQSSFRVPQLLDAPKSEIKLVSKMYHHVANNVMKYSEIKEMTFYKAWKDMIFVHSVLDSKNGKKKAFFDKYLHKTLLNVMSMPQVIKDDDKYDYLNKKGEEWLNPSSGKKSTLTFKQIEENAVKDTTKVDAILALASEGLSFHDELYEFVSNIDHSGTEVNSLKKYFKLLW